MASQGLILNFEKREKQIIIQRRQWDEKTMNSMNHAKDPDDDLVKNLDYETELNKTNLQHWRNLISYPIIFEWTFDRQEVKDLLDAMKVSLQTFKFSSLHEEELERIISRLENALPKSSTGWFFRFDQSSPKDGAGKWPMITARHVILQVVTSERARQCLQTGSTLYFCYFEPHWDPHRELRVFVNQGVVTAISQYNIDTLYFSNLSDSRLKEIALTILDKMKKIMPDTCAALNLSTFICDVLVEDDEPRIIEFNSSGYWLAGGSGYFHWQHDRDLLYNTNGDVYFRVKME